MRFNREHICALIGYAVRKLNSYARQGISIKLSCALTDHAHAISPGCIADHCKDFAIPHMAPAMNFIENVS